MLKRLWSYCMIRTFVYALVLLSLFILFRVPIFKGMGSFLIASDPWEATDAVVVLGGDSYMRGNEAIALYHQDTTLFFIATGGNQPEKIQALDTTMFEAELTRHWMVNQGVPINKIVTLTESTSTREEAKEVLEYCKAHQLRHVTILSSDYHLRRVRWVFEELFKENNIQTRYHGAKADGFVKDAWWQNETGLIITNNEYLKLLYYLFTDK